jgi:hypothetical protein
MLNKGESGIRMKAADIFNRPCYQVIDAQDFMPQVQESITKMGANKSGTPGNYGSHGRSLVEECLRPIGAAAKTPLAG